MNHEQSTLVAFVSGVVGLALSVAMLLPMTVDLLDGNDDWQTFCFSSMVVGFFSLMTVLATSARFVPLSRRSGLLLINTVWLGASLAASLPYVFSDLPVSFAQAFFESVSGLTTTGSTVLAGLDTMPRGLLLWRSITQWIGGVGIVAMGLFLLPFLRVGGMQLYRLESSAGSDRPVARFSQYLVDLLLLYVVLTLACTLGYILAGMTEFDALNHAMATISTGGFSTRDASMAAFGSGVHAVAIVFMIAGALPFVAILRILTARDFRAAQDPQIRAFAGVLLVLSLAAYLVAELALQAPSGALALHAVFNIVSVVTTTGFASTDYLAWGPPAIGVFLIATFLGGCAGSTSGGLKTFRLVLVFRSLTLGLKEVVYPHGAFGVRYAGVMLSDQTLRAVGVFVWLMVAIVLLATLGLMMTGQSLEAGFSAALTALTNTGPGLTPEIGPVGNFAKFSDPALWIMSTTMLLGRLEMITVLVLFTPTFWRS